VLLAVGAHSSRDLSIPGVDLDGVHKRNRLSAEREPGVSVHDREKGRRDRRRNVAMDVAPFRGARGAAPACGGGGIARAVAGKRGGGRDEGDGGRVALRAALGAQEVHLVCLESRKEMPAALEEIVEAEEEGIILHPGLGPHRVVGENGRVTGSKRLKTKWVFDAAGRFNPAFYEDSETISRLRHGDYGHRPAPQLDFLKLRMEWRYRAAG